MIMMMMIAPHLWDFVVFKKSYYSDVNSLLCSETSREASPAKQQIYQVLYICLSFICFWEENWATNIPYMIYMATNLKHTRRFSLQVPLQVEERAPVPEPDSKIQSSFQNSDLRNSESRARSSSELGTRSSESSSQQTYSSVQVILSFWWKWPNMAHIYNIKYVTCTDPLQIWLFLEFHTYHLFKIEFTMSKGSKMPQIMVSHLN